MRTLVSVMWIICKLFFVVTARDVFHSLSPPVMTNFTCNGRNSGFYADIENNCRLYHTCDNHGNKFTYFCPQDTAFRQEALVCDHAYLVDCKKSAKLIAKIPEYLLNDSNESPINSKNNQRSDTFSRSFRISAQPSVVLLAPKQSDDAVTTFVMSSTVFLRDQSHLGKNNQFLRKSQNSTNNKFLQKNSSSMTSQPPHIHQDFENNSTHSLNRETSRKHFFSHKDTIIHNPYLETLKSMQSTFSEDSGSTTPKITTAGTEFPIPDLIGTLDQLNNRNDDPYYPSQHINTQSYYTLIMKNDYRKSFDPYVQRSWQKKLDLKIPEVLPDLNSLEDPVDRRKHFYIDRIKKHINI